MTVDSDALLCYRIGCAAKDREGPPILPPCLMSPPIAAAIDWHEPVVGFLPAKRAKVNDYKVEWAWI